MQDLNCSNHKILLKRLLNQAFQWKVFLTGSSVSLSSSTSCFFLLEKSKRTLSFSQIRTEDWAAFFSSTWREIGAGTSSSETFGENFCKQIFIFCKIRYFILKTIVVRALVSFSSLEISFGSWTLKFWRLLFSCQIQNHYLCRFEFVCLIGFFKFS